MSGHVYTHNNRDATEARDHKLACARHVALKTELMGPRPTELMAAIMYDLDYPASLAQKKMDAAKLYIMPLEAERDGRVWD
tara:strand:- start:222 stop:464 length:243 start_codon:yes stop_codon:yes gene_type:complete